MRRHLVWVAAVGLLAAGCGHAVAPSTGQSAPHPAPSTTTSASPAQGGASGTGAATPSAGTASGASAAAVQKYLATARRAYPAKDDAGRVQVAQSVCTSLRTTSSKHDVVGSLAGELASQSTAEQVVDDAMAAYCPGAVAG